MDGQIWRHFSTQPVRRHKPVKNGIFCSFWAIFGLFVSEKGLQRPVTKIFIKAKSRGYQWKIYVQSQIWRHFHTQPAMDLRTLKMSHFKWFWGTLGIQKTLYPTNKYPYWPIVGFYNAKRSPGNYQTSSRGSNFFGPSGIFPNAGPLCTLKSYLETWVPTTVCI